MSWEKNGMKRSLSLGANNFEIHAEFVQNIHFVCVCVSRWKTIRMHGFHIALSLKLT